MHSALTYTLLDIGGSLWGTAVFATAMLAPGYMCAHVFDLCGFRTRSAAEQFAWGLVLSLGVGTLVLVAAVWAVGVMAGEILLAGLCIAAATIFFRSTSIGMRPRLGHVVFVCWTAVVVLSLVDIGTASRLWMSVTSYDHSVRVPFVDAVMRTGVVPVNPLYWPGHDSPLRYYYFWYVTCAVVGKLAHISARQALIASCVWPPAAVAAMLALYGKYLLGWPGRRLRERTRFAVALMAVTGLDVLIAVFDRLVGATPPGDMEWWSVDQVTSWADTFLWVPHHAAALVCCLLSFLLIWLSRETESKGERLALAIVSGVTFASAFGLSTYIAMGFCMVVALWLVRILFTTRDRRQLVAVALSLAVALVALAPYLRQLLHHGGSGEPAPRVLSFQVREMLSPHMLDGVPPLAKLAVHHSFAATQVSALLLLAPGYAIELGFFALVLLRAFRLPRKTEGERTLLYLVAATFLSVSFVRSTVIATNDYGVRAALLAQFFLLLLAVRVWEESSRGQKFFLVALAVIGVSGSIYQVTTLRLFLRQQQLGGNTSMRELAERNYAMRDAYAQLNQRIPTAAHLQYDSSAGGYFDYTHVLHAQRQFIAAGTDCNTGFGGEKSACAPIRQALQSLYAAGQAVSADRARTLCTQIGAQYLVATRWDHVWQDHAGWPWELPPVVSRPAVRIVNCSAP